MTTTTKITVLCGQCRAELAVPASAAGQKARCPNCQGVIVVPTAETVPLPPPPQSVMPDAEPPRPKTVRPFFAAAVDPKDADRVWPADDEPAPAPPPPPQPERVRSVPVRQPAPTEQRAEPRPTPPAPKPKAIPVPVPPAPKRAAARRDEPDDEPPPRPKLRRTRQDERAAKQAEDEARKRKMLMIAGGATAAGVVVLFSAMLLWPSKSKPTDRVTGDQAGLKVPDFRPPPDPFRPAPLPPADPFRPAELPPADPFRPAVMPPTVAPPADPFRPAPAPPARPARAARPGELPDPVTYWAFDEGKGDTAKDAQSPAVGTLREGAKWVPGVRGSALEFDGKAAWFEFGQNTPVSFGDNVPFTLACWVKPKATQHGPVFSFRGERHPAIDMATIVGVWTEKGKLCSWMRKDGSPFFPNEQFGKDPLTANEWHHVAVVRQADGTVEVYQDGALAAQKKSRDSNGAFTLKYGSLGRELFPHHRTFEKDDPATKHFAGAVDEFVAFDRALSPADLVKLAGR